MEEREGQTKEKLERWERKKDSKFNRWYKEIRKERISEYLKKGWAKG